jgi:hypothetical protein
LVRKSSSHPVAATKSSHPVASVFRQAGFFQKTL